MKAVISSVFGAAALAQAASIRHGHGHVHSKRAPAAAIEERAPFVNYMEASDVTLLQNKGIKIGQNLAAGASAPVTVGTTPQSNFVMNLHNAGDDDIVVVAWSGSGQSGAVDACFVGANQAAVTHTLKAGTNTSLTFDPSAANGAVSGALSAVYPNGGLTPFSGQVDNTWLEYTFTTANQFSTVDVSRLINMNGNKIEAHTYQDQAAKDAGDIACSSTMDACSFVCPDGESNCIVGTIQNCPVGSPNTVSDASGMDGGCAGMTATGGVVDVNFF